MIARTLFALLLACALCATACDDETPSTTDDTFADGDTGSDVPTGGGALCDPCVGSFDCGGAGDFCLSVDNPDTGETESFCGLDCTNDSTVCPASFVCQEVADGISQCIPDAGTCIDRCAEAGCDPGTTLCDPASGECLPLLGLCDIDCQLNEQCGGPNDRCVNLDTSGETICAQNCTEDAESCPEGYFCAALNTEGVSQCVPSALTCIDRCADVTCPEGLICDPFSGDCALPLGQCEEGCLNNALCGTTDADRCISLSDDGEVVCSLGCTDDPTVCPDGTFCAALADGSSNCVPNTLTCRTDRCDNVTCGPAQQCDPATGGCVLSIGLCEGPCANNNACLGPNDICLSFNEVDDPFCAQDCTDTGRCPLGYGCFLLNSGGRKCIPTSQSCDFLGAECTYEDRFANCPGEDVFCSAVRPGDTGTCLPNCEASPALCPSDLRFCADLEIHPTVCLPEPPFDPTTCGRFALTDNPIGRPCGDELSPFCPEPNDICYDPTGTPAASFCTRNCTEDADCGAGTVCINAPGEANPICVPEACSFCIDPPELGGQTDLLASALKAVNLGRCDLIISQDHMNLLPVEQRDPPGLLPAHKRLWRHPTGGATAARGIAADLDAAIQNATPVTDAILASARGAGFDPELTTQTYNINATQPLADALAKLITVAGGTADISALEADAADIPLALQNQIAPLLLAMRDQLSVRRTALALLEDDNPNLIALFDAAHGFHLRLPAGMSPPDPNATPTSLFVGGTSYKLDVMAEAALSLTAQIEAQGFATDSSWGAFEFNQPTPIGRIIIRGTDSDTYDPTTDTTLTDDIALLLDAGGDDVYRIPAGANTSTANPFALHIDLDGADTYSYVEVPDTNDGTFQVSDADGRYAPSLPLNQEDGPVSLSSTGRQGSGRLGVGLLFDFGNASDDYQSLRLSQGFGLFGVGVLYDAGGADTYAVEAAGQGAGMWGIGLLLDHGTDLDQYTGYHMVQGVGATYGVGALLDVGGDDVYTAVPGKGSGLEVLYFNLFDRARSNFSVAQGAALGRGINLPTDDTDYLAGGLGLLRDLSGNDTYTAAVGAQGAGFFYGAGLLLDADGTDAYDARRYAQGAGQQMALGLLLDQAGDDLYNPTIDRANIAHGLGEDLGVGILVDDAGSDTYAFTNTSGGVGIANGIGLFADHDGDDTYTVTSDQSLGYGILSNEGSQPGDPRRDVLTLGVFIDGGGTDTYGPSGTAPSDAADNASWTGHADIQLIVEFGTAQDSTGTSGL